MTRLCRTERTHEPSGTARRKTSNTVADGTERGWPQRIHILKSCGGGGGGLDLIVNVNYIDKIRSF